MRGVMITAALCFGVLAVVGVVLGIVAFTNSRSSSSSAASASSASPVSDVSTVTDNGAPPVVTVVVSAQPSSPPTGAASLDVDTCGCPSGPQGPPQCATEHRWGVNKQWNNDTQAFEIQVTTEAQQVLAGIYDLVISNSGVPSTTLQSVYVGLEEAVPSGGNAPGPSGKNWKRIAQAVVSQADACNVNTNTYNKEAWLCSTQGSSQVAYHAYGTLGSEVSVFDKDGNSIAGLANVSIPTTSADCDKDGNVRDGGFDGPSCPVINGVRGFDDDGDGRVDEDGYCCNVIRLQLRYRFDLVAAGTNATALAGKNVRLNVLPTFLAGGARGSSCATDVNCDGTVSAPEQNARTVQQRYPFTFPLACGERCGCIALYDTPIPIKTCPNCPTSDPDCCYAASVTFDPVAIDRYPICSHNLTSLEFDLRVNVSYECPDPNPSLTLTTVGNRVEIFAGGTDDVCVDLFGASLLSPNEDLAFFDFECPATYEPSPSPESATPTPSSPPTPRPPPPGHMCSYTGGIFASKQKCDTDDLMGYTDPYAVCEHRREAIKPACLINGCVDMDGDYTEIFGRLRSIFTPIVYASRVVFLSPPPSANISLILADMYRRFVVDQLENPVTPYHFTQSLAFTTPLDVMTTSARQLARQYAVARFAAQMALYDTNTTLVNEFNALTYSDSDECNALVVPAARNRKFVDVLAVAECIISIDAPETYGAASYWSNTTTACNNFCGYTGSQHDTCVSFLSTYTRASGFTSGGESIWAALSGLLDLYNNEFDECRPAATGCLVLPVA